MWTKKSQTIQGGRMEETRLRFVRCSYCGHDGSHQQKVGKSVGVFRLRELYDNMELRQCIKCRKVHAIRKVGKPLVWEDLPPLYKQEWKKQLFDDYKSFPEYKDTDEYAKYLAWKEKRNLRKLQLNKGGKNGKRI